MRHIWAVFGRFWVIWVFFGPFWIPGANSLCFVVFWLVWCLFFMFLVEFGMTFKISVRFARICGVPR